jgi:hypothetical protein
MSAMLKRIAQLRGGDELPETTSKPPVVGIEAADEEAPPESPVRQLQHQPSERRIINVLEPRNFGSPQSPFPSDAKSPRSDPQAPSTPSSPLSNFFRRKQRVFPESGATSDPQDARASHADMRKLSSWWALDVASGAAKDRSLISDLDGAAREFEQRISLTAPWYIILPISRPRVAWDILIVVLLVINVFLVHSPHLPLR